MTASAPDHSPAPAPGPSGAGCGGAMSHRAWSALPDMSPPFRRGRPEDRVIGDIQACLLRSSSWADPAPVHVAVSGAPGSGRTRLVLEATREKSLASRVVYADGPAAAAAALDGLDPQGGGPGTILVLDECDHRQQAGAWMRLRGNRAGIDLVTIYDEAGIEGGGTRQIVVEDMADEQIAEIISGYAKGGAGAGAIARWVEYCRPSPRAAHMVGSGLASSPGDLPRAPEDVQMWERLIGRGDSGGERGDRLTVMLWLALFTRFGFDIPHEKDSAQVAGIIGERHPEITARRFRDIVEYLRSIRALRGGPVLHISPRVLHEHLWSRWWDVYGPDGPPRPPPPDGGSGADAAMPTLHGRYADMLESLEGKKGAERAGRALLGVGGPLRGDADPIRPIASGLFFAAAGACPAAALEYVEEAVSGALLRGEGLGRHGYAAVSAAQCMLRRRETFAGAARLLLAIVEAGRGGGNNGGSGGEEDDRTADDADRSFAGAFDPAPQAGFADTPLAERLGVLAGAVRDGAAGKGGGGGHSRLAALRACGAVLEMRRYTPAVPHRRGVGSIADYWRPEDRAGLAAYLRGVLELLVEAWTDPRSGDDVRREAAGAVLGSLAQAALLPEIAERAVEAAEGMCAAGLIDGESLLAAAESLAVHESGRIDPAAMRRIGAIVARESGAGGLRGRMARRIGREACLRRGRLGTAANEEEEIGRLAGELAGDSAALDEGLEWLAGEEADGRSAALLGRELAARAGGAGWGGRMLGRIEEAARRAGDGDGSGRGGGGRYLLAGYLAWACRNLPDAAEDAMDGMLGDGALRGVLPMMPGMSGGVSDRSVRRLLECARNGWLGREEALAGLGYGRLLDAAAEGTFWDVVHALIGGPGEGSGPASKEGLAGPAALNMVYTRYARGADGEGGGGAGPLPGAVLGVLLHEAVIGGEAGEEVRRIPVRKWARVAHALALAGGEGREGAAGEPAAAAVRLAAAAIGRIGRPGIFESDAAIAEVLPVLGEILRIRPREVWGIAMSCAGPPYDKRASRVHAWLAGGRGWLGMPREALDSIGAIRHVPVPYLFEWAAEDAGPRPGRIADMLPPRLDIAREFLSRFDGCKGVAEGLVRAFDSAEAGACEEVESEGAAGGMLALMEDALRIEPDPAVAAWLGSRIEELKAGEKG